MQIRYHKDFKKSFNLLPLAIQKKFFNKIELFEQNRSHPSLHIEKLEPKILNKWSFRLDSNYRLIFEFLANDSILFIDVGSHDKIYRKIK